MHQALGGVVSADAAPSPGDCDRDRSVPPRQLERAYQQVRRLLYLRVLSEGQRLHELEWSRRLGVGRSAMREAMARLAAEGLLAKSPGRGYAVPRLDARGVGEAMELRILFEIESVRRICANRLNTPGAMERLERMCTQFESLSRQDYCLAVLEADWRFHQMVVTLSGNVRLSALHAATPVSVALGPDRGDNLVFVGSPGHAQGHRQLLAALRQGDAAAAENVLRLHYAGAGVPKPPASGTQNMSV